MGKRRETNLRDTQVEKKRCEGNYPACLYHYTTWDAFVGIMKNQEMWFGSTASMNDKNENVQFLTEVKTALLSALQTTTEQEKCETFFNQVFERLNIEYPFAACLSVAKDDAAQWERYAANAKGVCIVFNTRNLFRAFWNCNVMTNRVFYRRNITEHDHYKNLLRYFVSGKNEFRDEKGNIDNLLAISCLHKHESFESEKEVRIATVGKRIPKYAEVDYPTSSERMRKILKFNLEALCKAEEMEFQDLFDSIIIGPRSSSTRHEIEEFLNSLGYISLGKKVEKSLCPLR